IRGPDSHARERIAAAVAIGQARPAYEVASSDVSLAAANGADASSPSADVERLGRRIDVLTALAGRPELESRTREESRRTRRSADDTIESVTTIETALGGRIDALLSAREADESRALFLMRTEALLAVIVGLWIAVLLARTIADRDRRELERARSEGERLLAELERQRTLEDLAVTEAHFRAVFDRSSIGVAILDRDGTVLRGNRALYDMLGTVDGNHIGAAHPDFARLLAGEIESFATELLSMGNDGARVWEATLSLVRDDDGTPRFAISMINDITARKRSDDRLRHDATHDSLSGLPNRAYFCDRLRATFFSGRVPEGTTAVLFIDLDEFKLINDSLGHEIGDRVLIATGERLRASTRNEDCIARFGGDEFAVLLDGRHTREDLEATVHRLGRSLAEPLDIDGREIFVTASIGVAFVNAAYRSVEEILRDADTAMYYAKSTGRARSAVFDSSMHERAARRLEIATHLRRGLEREQFHLVYQPIVSLETGAIESCEALLRWENAELGLVPPDEFIPVAEELGLIVPIGRYVIDCACRQFAAWRNEVADHPARVSVNTSVREIVQADFVDAVEATVMRYGMQPGQLMLEITETAILSNPKSHVALERLKGVGVALAIDGFGTGYSSLRHLELFPFDEMKIDRSLVGGADGRLASESSVTIMLTLARSRGVRAVAEGVETGLQAQRLRTLGCTSAQGHLFCRPVSANDVPDLFAREADFAT
ncbi:MAG: EAL domain-containing protein, partial [Candidatus Eremiobacteraeota bacterium]|nr:EAL domain-containing protein [Candidatus Eremiobacteraeota bacterium]